MLTEQMTKADKDWGTVFENLCLARKASERGFVDVTSKDFKEFGLEPRLLTKVDHSHQIPQPLKVNGLTILTLSSSSWRLSQFDIFRTLPLWKPIDKYTTVKHLPSWIDSIDPANITGEGALMNAAFSSGILEDFCEERVVPTVSGKSRSGKFSFSVDLLDKSKTNVQVDGAQIEIDAGYEGDSSLFLFEAKKHISRDFNVRQLYYPFRAWQQKVSKPVRSIFITLANDVFDLTEFSFVDPNDFSSAEIVKHKRYALSQKRIALSELVELAHQPNEPQGLNFDLSAPFPQADDFERLMDLAAFIGERPRTMDDIALNYDFHVRQSDYYFSALRFLGVAEIRSDEFGQRLRCLTESGLRIIALPPRERILAYASILLGITPVRLAFLGAINSGKFPHLEKIEEIILEEEASFGISGSTLRRRSQTVLSWTRWLIGLDEGSLF